MMARQQRRREVKMSTRRAGLRTAVLACLALLSSMSFATANEPLSTPNDSGASSRESDAQLPAWLWGEWSRDWILRGKVKSSTLDVHYLQTPTYFADIRIPKVRSDFSAVKSFADLTDQQLRLLAGQNGFAGRTTLAGTVATWSHEVAFQPSDGTADTGRLERRPPDGMHEIGLDGSYTESWRRLSDAKGQYLVIRVEHSGRLLRTLVVVGNRFVYVRNRVKDLPIASSLEALIETTKATREQVVDYLNCEFSVGRVRGGSVPWEIQQSTLPWREGHHLDFVEQLSVRNGGAALVPRAVGDDQWFVPVNTWRSHDINALFGG
jgi:hypothetical protein